MHAAGAHCAMPVPRNVRSRLASLTGSAGHLALPAHLRWGASACRKTARVWGSPAQRWGGSVMTERARVWGADGATQVANETVPVVARARDGQDCEARHAARRQNRRDDDEQHASYARRFKPNPDQPDHRPLLRHEVAAPATPAARRWWCVTRTCAPTYAQLKSKVDAFACGLMRLGLEPGRRIGIWSQNNMAEWALTQFASARPAWCW